MGRVLVTGGAGFIGRHVVRLLLQQGYDVRVLDSLIDQVHGKAERDPVLRETELIRADVRDLDRVMAALEGVDHVIHLAAEVGVGQSMYAIERYVSANDSGTAVLFQALIDRPVKRVVTASSMSIYGEGLYRTHDGHLLEDVVRAPRPGREWDPRDPDGTPLIPVPTPESKRPNLTSVYAITKFVQERLTMTVGPAYGIESTALRLFNVYGPGQALSNPYTGVLAIFASRMQNSERPMVFEDGEQRRDFVHVDDVARAFVLAMTHPGAPDQVFNIGSGRDASILQVGEALAMAMGVPELKPEVTFKSRVGDTRHCFADISHARAVLGFEARRTFADSLGEMAEWVAQQRAEDRVHHARTELEQRGLVA